MRRLHITGVRITGKLLQIYVVTVQRLVAKNNFAMKKLSSSDVMFLGLLQILQEFLYFCGFEGIVEVVQRCYQHKNPEQTDRM